jgi:hypothetical protein
MVPVRFSQSNRVGLFADYSDRLSGCRAAECLICLTFDDIIAITKGHEATSLSVEAQAGDLDGLGCATERESLRIGALILPQFPPLFKEFCRKRWDLL